MKQQTKDLILMVTLIVVVILLAIIATKQTPAPIVSPRVVVPTSEVIALAGQSQRRTEVVDLWTASTIATTTLQTQEIEVGAFAKARVWYSPTVSNVNTITLTWQASPDDTDDSTWVDIGQFQSSTVSASPIYTTHDITADKYLRFTIKPSNTEAITPVVWLVLKD